MDLQHHFVSTKLHSDLCPPMQTYKKINPMYPTLWHYMFLVLKIVINFMFDKSMGWHY